VLFGAPRFDALASVEGDTGGRALIAREPVERVAVDDPGIHRDVDRPADLG
jgi:molybdenum cofactor cytidylyltransferase